tara:strand:+ start:2557 stop:7956 length:5400 start_codon:yes stop_codon:yes gene_type:complete
MPVVKVPDGRLVNFPDDMPREEIKSIIADKFPDASFERTPSTPELGLMDTFGGGVSRGLSRLGSTFTDIIPAMVGSAVGADEYAQEQFAEAAEKQRISELLNPTQFASYKDVEGIGDFTRFVGETIGEQVGNLGLTVGTALTGGALAPVAGAARATGQLAGAAFGSYALNAPEVFENIYRETGETAPGTALIFGAGAAALDSILPAALARNISGPMKAGIVTKLLERSGMQQGVLRSGTAGLFSGLGVEGITEGAQEGISIAAERFIDDNPDVFGSKEFDRIMEASVRGAVAGGGFGTVGGGVQGAREGAQRRQRLQDLKESRKLRDDLNKKGEEAFTEYVEQFDTALKNVEENTKQAQEARAKKAAKTQPKTPAEVFQADTTQFDAFGQPVQVDITEVAKFTKPQVQQEAQRRARNNNTKVSEELKNVRAEVKTAKDTIATQEKERKAQEKLDAQRRKQLLGAKQLDLPLEPSKQERAVRQANLEDVVREEAEGIVDARFEGQSRPDNFEDLVQQEIETINQRSFEGQGDVFAGMPEGEITRAPAIGTALNDFLAEKNIPVNSATKKALAGKDLAVPEQRQEAVNELNTVLENTKGKEPYKKKIDAAIVALGGTPVQTTEITADITEDQLQAVNEFVDDILVPKKRKTKTKGKPTKPVVTKSFADELAQSSPLTEEASTETETKKTGQTSVFDRRGKKSFNKPTYRGKALNRAQRRIAERGNFKQLLSDLINTQPREIQQVLRKIRSQSLATKLVIGATPEGTSGYYDAATDTIVLDPQEGLTEETFLHEATHAALAQALNNPDLQITKDFFKFYSDIKDQMGDMYGGQDLQEFAAELVGNPEFQALLKDTKAPDAPASKNLFRSIMEAIARFFGFRPKQTAYAKGLDFIDKVLDVSQDVEPTLFDRLLLGTPQSAGNALRDAIRGVPTLAGKNKERVLNTLSRSGELMSRAMGVLRMHDFAKLFAGTELGRVAGEIRDIVLQRQASVEKKIKDLQTAFRRYDKVRKEHTKDFEKLGKIAFKAREKAYDLVNVDGKEFNYNKLNAEQKAEFNNLKNQLNNLHPDVQAAYKEMRETYRKMYEAYKTKILSLAEKSKIKDLEKQFTRTHSAVGYVPFLRHGAYYLEFNSTNPDGTKRREVVSFSSPRLRAQYIKDNNIASNQVVRQFKNLEEAVYNQADHPDSSFVVQLMNSTDPSLDAAAKNAIYQGYLAAFPEHSFMNRLRRAKLTPGADTDLARSFGDTMVKWARKEAALEYIPKLTEKFDEMGRLEVGTNPRQQAARDAIMRRKDFTLSPNYSDLTSFFATGAYNLFLFGNISSAAVNTSAIALLSMPLLGGQYGYAKANAAIARAMKTAMPSLQNFNKDTFTFDDAPWTKNQRYTTLLDTLDKYGQRQHTMQREILEGAKQAMDDYSSFGAKTMNLGSIPFTAAEEYSRATTAIAAYDLALDAGKSQKVAAEEAVKLTMDVHTSGMAAEGPGWLQHGYGRVMFTFKTFIWNSASITAQAMNASLRGESAEVRKQARKQVLGIYMVSGALAGVNGMPFFGAAATFANIANALLGDDEEPFNARDLSREFMGDFLFKGPLNYATNLEISNRVGIANGLLFREDPYSVEQNGLLMTAVMQSTGPVGSFALNLERNVPKQLERGEYLRAIESMSPSGLRNLFKTTRFAQEGARTANGQPIMEDFNGFQLALQAFGFTPAELSNLYENRSAALNFQSKVRAKKQKILKQYYLGVTTGDRGLQRKALADYRKFARNFPSLINEDTLARSFKSRAKSEQELLYGVRFDKNLLPDIEERFFDD